MSYTDYIATELTKLGERTMLNLQFVIEKITAGKEMTPEEREGVSKQLDLAKEKIKSIWPKSQLMKDDIAKLEPYFAQQVNFEATSHSRFLKPMCEEALVYLSELIGDNLQNIKGILRASYPNMSFQLKTYFPDPDKRESILNELNIVIADLTLDYFKTEETKLAEEKAAGLVTPSGLSQSFYNTENRCWAPSKAALERDILTVRRYFRVAVFDMKKEVRAQLDGRKQKDSVRALRRLEDDVVMQFDEMPKSLIAPDIFSSIDPEDRAKQTKDIAEKIQKEHTKYFDEIKAMNADAYKRMYGLVFRLSVTTFHLKDLRSAVKIL